MHSRYMCTRVSSSVQKRQMLKDTVKCIVNPFVPMAPCRTQYIFIRVEDLGGIEVGPLELSLFHRLQDVPLLGIEVGYEDKEGDDVKHTTCECTT